MADEPACTVHGFLVELIEAYSRRRSGPGLRGADAAGEGPPASLVLAEAALRLWQAGGQAGVRPPQLAVIGPTQVGKSTIVNLLLGQDLAPVSPLAGHTIHPQAFWFSSDEEVCDVWAAALLPGWTRCQPAELTRDCLEAYALTRVEPAAASGAPSQGPGVGLPTCVVWDTPDFDSLSARQYERGVLEVAALADAYLLVLSKEKYADLSVWNMLRLLEPLGRPLMVCVNKLTPEAVSPVLDSLRRRLAEQVASWADVPIVSIEYSPQLAVGSVSDARAALRMVGETSVMGASRPTQGSAATGGTADEMSAATVRGDGLEALLEAAGQQLRRVRRTPAGVQALLREHWESWTAPVRAEQAAVEEWHERVDSALQTFLTRYRRDYLEHPQRYDSFRRAAVELLRLLEIPKLSGWVTSARQVVTWPVRQLWATGQAWRARRGEHVRDPGPEAAVLRDALEAVWTELLREVGRRMVAADPCAGRPDVAAGLRAGRPDVAADPCAGRPDRSGRSPWNRHPAGFSVPCWPSAGQGVWRVIGRRLEADEARLRERFEQAVEAHHQQVTQEVHAAATRLYEELRRHPSRLAALRAARATLDVGALLLAVKSGGLSPIDLLWAPATFALSSLLTEGLAGLQMAAVASGLRRRQYQGVQEQLVGQVLGPELRAVGENWAAADVSPAARLVDEGLFGVPAGRMLSAEQALAAWERQEHAHD